MKRIIEIIRRMGKAENNAAFEFDKAAFEFDYAHSTAVAASSMRWFRLRSTTETRVAASSRGLSEVASSRGLSEVASSRGLSVAEAPTKELDKSSFYYSYQTVKLLMKEKE